MGGLVPGGLVPEGVLVDGALVPGEEDGEFPPELGAGAAKVSAGVMMFAG